MTSDYSTCDVLILGTGIAGLCTAIELAEAGKNVVIATRAFEPQESNTFWAQGGIVFPKEHDPSLIDDIQLASSKTSNVLAAKQLIEEGHQGVKELLLNKAKTEFNRDDRGELTFTKEAAHSENRILFNKDFTGKAISLSLLNYIKDEKRFPNIKILTGHTAIDLMTPNHHGKKLSQRYEENQVVGAYLFDQKNDIVKSFFAKKTVLATGGIGALYFHHTNSMGARGDGHAMAKRAGAQIINMEFVQFHPTTFYDRSSHRRFLISEAVRGEGGRLINSKGHEFMKEAHPLSELAPRDIVSRVIVQEMIGSGENCVYLDISHKDKKWIQNRFPSIYEHCLANNVDITKSPIPVVPAAHYTLGGVKIDLQSKTTLKNLYAVGEVACSGLHGANRLASTSLLEGLTTARVASRDILTSMSDQEVYPIDMIRPWEQKSKDYDPALVSQDWVSVRQTMWNYAGIIRSRDRLVRAQGMLGRLSEQIQQFYRHARLSDEIIGIRNAVEVGQMVISSSLRTKTSIGCFYLK